MERTVKTQKQLQLNRVNINKSHSDLSVYLYGVGIEQLYCSCYQMTLENSISKF